MRFFYIILSFLFFTNLFSQEIVQGIITEAETGLPLENVTVFDIKTNKWTISDKNGTFIMPVHKQKIVTLNFRVLGKMEKSISIDQSDFFKTIQISLQNKDLRLDEIIVSVKKGKEYSEVSLDRESINQVQAFSINEVLEQLPGQAMTNFYLSEFKPIVFRTAKPSSVADAAFGNKSFGTAVVIDGIPVSNNENMQSYAGNSLSPFSPNYLGFGDNTQGFNGYFSNANFGADLREIPTDNIEKIEVVQGIPSAKYGDLTSGLIKIEQKAGKSPYRIYTSLRDGATEFGFNKGFRLSERAGAINLSLSKLESNSSPRMSFTNYERINTNLIWSWNSKSKNIKNSLSFSYGFNNDRVNYEEEDRDNKIVKNRKKDFSFSNRFKWNFNNDAFLDNMDVNFNFNYSDHFTFESKFVNIGGSIVGTSTEEGVYTGTYTPVSYTTVKAIEGIPISSFFSTDLFKTFNTGKWSHYVAMGASFRMSDNKGRGRLGSPETMISAFANTNGNGSQGFRPYNYGENIRAEYQFSLYAEDNISIRWENNTLNFNAGLRYDNMYGTSLFGPRINSYFSTDKYKIRGGFGLTSKAPSLNQIYTGPRYYDAVLGDYRLPGYYNLGIIQTFIDYADNTNLKPSKSIRSELGFDYLLPFGEINITGYYNKLYDGVTGEALPSVREVAELEITYNNPEIPTYSIVGYNPYYFTLSKLVNKYESIDKGLELFLTIKKMPLRNFTMDIQGSYVETENRNKADNFYRSTNAVSNEKYGIYGPYTHYYKQVRAGVNLNYHLSKIGMIVSLRSEHFITDNNHYIINDSPYAYLDATLNRITIPTEDRNNSNLYGHIIRTPSAYNKNSNKIYNNFHLRLSKDFLNGFKFSFYASNLFDLKTTGVYLENNRYVTRMNPNLVKLSFGTKIEYQF